VVRVHLTSKGKKMRSKSKEVVLKFNEHIRENIDQKKLQTFFEVIGEINGLLEKNNIFDSNKEHEHEKNHS
jgi:DNA-binding MarR family transcriptional regulator